MWFIAILICYLLEVFLKSYTYVLTTQKTFFIFLTRK